ncbi:MAG: tetratricopeptide repeat protein [Coriobacteriia bacterium]|nr:tetratricopeptide repeat protein [Coriobacteriia bacterium]
MPMQSIPQQRVAEKLDEYMSHRDYAGAERHLQYWLAEAQAIGDGRGELMVRNELVGHFRKTGNAEQAFKHAEAALGLLDDLGFSESISAGTTYTNIATAYNAFGRDAESLELFQKALAVYKASPHTAPQLLGGLYNNMALTCVALGRFDEAFALYREALETMSHVENGELEQAITYLNMADAVESQANSNPQDDDSIAEHEIERLLDTALELLDTPSVPRDGYYAFVCEKCAPAFGHHGYFLADEDLRARANDIYARA